MNPVTTRVTVGEPWGKQVVPNITLEEVNFFGRPNFSGEVDNFGESKRQFTVLIKNEDADALRALGYNVKTKIPTPEEVEQGREMISHLKVAVDVIIDRTTGEERGSDVIAVMGEQHEKLTGATMGIIDRARVHQIDMELRAWCYNQKDVDNGLDQPKYSARLVACVAVIQRSILGEKYGHLI